MIARLSPAEQALHPHVPEIDRARARVVIVPVLTPGIGGMTLGRFILVRRGRDLDRALLAHELVHVRQWRELGVARFLAAYLGAYCSARFRGMRHWDAYRAIPFEREARELSGG